MPSVDRQWIHQNAYRYKVVTEDEGMTEYLKPLTEFLSKTTKSAYRALYSEEIGQL